MPKKILTCCLVVIFCLAALSVSAQQLEVPGTGACETILKELAFAFNNKNRENKIIIPPSVGTNGGIRLVADGTAQLGRVAHTLDEKEKRHNLQYLVFAKDPIVFAVGHKTGIDELSSRQLADVFSGKVENWQEVGGNNQLIRLLIREHHDSSLLILQDKLAAFKDLVFSDKAKVFYHDYEMVKGLNKYTTAIGWLTNSSMYDVAFTVKAISVDGIKATRENVMAGKYKLISDYAFIYKKNKLTGLAKEFVDFIFSDEGREILSNAGMVPVDRHGQ